MQNSETFREFNMEFELLSWEFLLADIPEPDPGKLNFRQKVKERPLTFFRETGVVTKLIDHLNVRKI